MTQTWPASIARLSTRWRMLTTALVYGYDSAQGGEDELGDVRGSIKEVGDKYEPGFAEP